MKSVRLCASLPVSASVRLADDATDALQRGQRRAGCDADRVDAST
jgi:hypothetical protein